MVVGVATTSAAPANSITYEISGTAQDPLEVTYKGSDGNAPCLTEFPS